MPEQYCFIYVTTKDVAEAQRIGAAIVAEKIVACVNILDGMQSIYWWKGAVVDDRETVLIAKTRLTLSASATDRIRALHSYTCPCIVILPILEGNPAYLAWIAENTQEPPPAQAAPADRAPKPRA
jgi:periplasmic divalent cation tolerance protein